MENGLRMRDCEIKRFVLHSQNIYDREGQQGRTPEDKYYFTWTAKGVRCYPKFQLKGVVIEGMNTEQYSTVQYSTVQYCTVQVRGVYKVITLSVRVHWLPLSVILVLSAFGYSQDGKNECNQGLLLECIHNLIPFL